MKVKTFEGFHYQTLIKTTKTENCTENFQTDGNLSELFIG